MRVEPFRKHLLISQLFLFYSCFVLFLCGFMSVIRAKVFTKCELATELRDQLRKSDFAYCGEWICLAEALSGLNSSLLNSLDDESAHYGIFQIRGGRWCREETSKTNAGLRDVCGVNCSALLDDDLIDDIQCAIKIKSLEGFEAWDVWTDACYLENIYEYTYIKNCSVTPQPLETDLAKCEIAAQLKKHPLRKKIGSIGNWLCAANAISELQIRSVFPAGKTGALSRDYGLFGISNQDWCEDEFSDSNPTFQNGCKLNCSALLDNDLTDDVQCALKIQEEGLSIYSTQWIANCEGENIYDFVYLENCSVTGNPMGGEITKCELATELRKHLGEEDFFNDIGNWICTAKAVSGLSTSFVVPKMDGGVSITVYGLFGLSNLAWCEGESSWARDTFVSGCKLNCSDLADKNLTGDIQCAIKYRSNKSFNIWPEWSSDCEGIDLFEKFEYVYIKNCPAAPLPSIPAFKNNTREITFVEGSSGHIDCHASGSPKPRVVWENIEKLPDLRTHLSNGNGTITLIFPIVTLSHQAVYKCTATNRLGQVEEIFKLTVEQAQVKGKGSEANSLSFYGITIGLPMVIVILVLSVIAYYFRFVLLRLNNLTDAELNEFLHGQPSELPTDGSEPDSILLPYNRDYDLQKSRLSFGNSKIIGEGQFGVVTKAELNGRVVAVKTIKPSAEKLYLKALLSELKVMIHLGINPYLVSLIGAVTEGLSKGVLLVIVEYCELGDLQTYLMHNKTQFNPERVYSNLGSESGIRVYQNRVQLTSQLIKWSSQIAKGMCYLGTKKVIHGDLAARNVLLSSDHNIKITDFGLARQLYGYTHYVKKQQAPLPWRHMAIESLRDMRFSSMSDAWAFGVTLWEIFSLGDVPYAGRSWSLDFVNELENGLTLLKPKYAPGEMYSLMKSCWNVEQYERPLFQSLVYQLEMHMT